MKKIMALGCMAAALAAWASDGISWGLMMQLGHDMWDDGGSASNRTDRKIWNEVTKFASEKGVNMLLIDLGEGMIYPSHPELAVEGSWTPDEMKKELARLRCLGLEPIPKLNFSASHDAWLKEYSRMLSTPEYYKVCADVIRDVCEIFGRPRLFHLGWDEEKFIAQKRKALAVVRQGDLWWHDFMFTVGEVEKNGSRAWIWSDQNWKHHDDFLKRMPHSVMQSNWHYFYLQHMVRNDKEINKLDWPEAWAGPLGFLELEAAKYDQIPCASNYKVPKNLEIIVKFCKEHVAHERIKGFMMAPWAGTYGEKNRAKLLEACSLVENARRIWESDEKDVVIYGATSAGIAAAVQARKMGLEPVVIEPSAALKVLEPLEKEWALVIRRNERLDRGPGSVEKKDGRIVAIRTEGGMRYAAKMFLDCTCEGDLMAAAGVDPYVKKGGTSSGLGVNPLHHSSRAAAQIRAADRAVTSPP